MYKSDVSFMEGSLAILITFAIWTIGPILAVVIYKFVYETYYKLKGK